MNKICNATPSFGSKPLYMAKLKKQLPIFPIKINRDVFISELDETDKDRLFNIESKWEKTIYGAKIKSPIADGIPKKHDKNIASSWTSCASSLFPLLLKFFDKTGKILKLEKQKKDIQILSVK